MNIGMDKIDLRTLAEHTEFFTGADLKAVCREAALIHLRLHKDDNILVYVINFRVRNILRRQLPNLSRLFLKR